MLGLAVPLSWGWPGRRMPLALLPPALHLLTGLLSGCTCRERSGHLSEGQMDGGVGEGR